MTTAEVIDVTPDEPTKKKPTLGGKIINLVLVPIIIAPLLLWDGFVTQQLWNWFVAPLGTPTLTFSHAVGLSIAMGFFIHSALRVTIYDMIKDHTRTDNTFIRKSMLWKGGIFFPGLALVLGWIVKVLS